MEIFFFFTLRPSDINTTLTYVLMDNFCPSLNRILKVASFFPIQIISLDL